ncbi:unnamed protein product [Echinostoma caproni]|uniref:RNA polymerase II-associated protein 3 n=1 Tax=Echinostoma caproni TaxID=27848 RepID=A0A183AAQ7_9TREM|nr:unnamed protein product [Echinostoma caproni]
MDPEKFVEIQKQMRENNQEVADFLSDLDSWKKQVECQNARLQSEKENTSLPAIRNSLFKKQKKKRHGDESVGSNKTVHQRIRGSDYRAWDKFDVDKALEEVDKPDQDKEVNEDGETSETDDEMEDRRRLSLAKEARELGNLRFKEGKFQDAIEQYTTSVRLTPEDPVPYTNRALAFLKLERYASAESDCSAALALDKKCVKALFRRAIARKGLQKKSEAIEDLKSLLALDENNKAAITELTLLTGKPPGAETSASEVPNQSSLLPRPSLRGSRKLRRIPIVEVGGESAVQPPTTHTAPPKILTTALPPSGNKKSPSKPVKTVPLPQTRVNPSVSAGASSDPDTPKQLCSLGDSKKQTQTVHYSSTNPVFPIPSNWYQLERDLRELSGGERTALSQTAVDYLCSLEPADYGRIISSNLEPSFLSQLLYAFHASNQLTIEGIASRLDALSNLPRFDVAWCLTDDHERGLFKQLMSRIEASPEVPSESKQHLRQVYL